MAGWWWVVAVYEGERQDTNARIGIIPDKYIPQATTLAPLGRMLTKGYVDG